MASEYLENPSTFSQTWSSLAAKPWSNQFKNPAKSESVYTCVHERECKECALVGKTLPACRAHESDQPTLS